MSALPASPAPADDAPHVQRAYRCRCGNRVFFRNSLCLACSAQLGYVAERQQLVSLQPGPQEGLWTLDDGSPGLWRRCANHALAASCNWLVPAQVAAGVPVAPDAEAVPIQTLCEACRLNRTVPNLDNAGNGERWQKIELAKRRLVSSLIGLGLPVERRVDGVSQGLLFDFVESEPQGPAVLTGHDSGLITLNILEADDDYREKMRVQLGEPYRTVLGHLRHEVGHYYWDRLVDDPQWIDRFRTLFGDERQDYGEALKRHYASPRQDWAQSFVTVYASSHPWEDWAETWAHYLHMVDVVHTANSFGLQAREYVSEPGVFTREDLYDADDPGGPLFLDWLHEWFALTAVLNEMSRSMGEHDFHPFVLPRAAVPKLHFVHMLVAAARAAAPLPPKPFKAEAGDAEAAGQPRAPGGAPAPAAQSLEEAAPALPPDQAAQTGGASAGTASATGSPATLPN